MNHLRMLDPLFAQVLLTFLVWSWLLWGRVTTLTWGKINPQKTQDEEQSRKIFHAYQNQSDNLENLFELPVLFYIAVLIVFFTQTADLVFVYLGWGFVLGRAIHSLIHCTYNKIVHRFYAYVLSSMLLWVFWVRLGVVLYQKLALNG